MKVVRLVILAVVASLFGCGICPVPPMDSSDQAQLNRNRTLWKNAHLANYTFTYKRVCFCPPEEDIVVTVQDGEVTAASYSPSNTPVTPPRLDALLTVEELFQVIQKAITDEVARLDVKYNPTLGYPERISIDVDERIADEEMTHLVSNLH